jgi:hypothetical protein
MNDKYSRVEQACIDLTRTQQPVTFTAVAHAADISRATLYRNPALRAIVEHHRQTAPPTNTLDRLNQDLDTLRIAVAELADRIRHHDEQIRRLNRLTNNPGTN